MTDSDPTTTPPSVPDPEAAPVPTTVSLSPDDLTRVVQQVVRSEIKTAQDRAFEEARRMQPQPPATPPKPDEKEERATAKVRAFAEDPDSFLDTELGARVDKRLEERLSPGLQPMVEQQRDTLIEREARSVDEKFGTGYFDAKVKPLLFTEDKKGALDVLHPFQQANRERVHLTVQAILGMLMSEDPDAVLEAREKHKAAERRAQEPPFSWGAGAPPVGDPNAKLPQPLREAIARGLEHGSNMTEDDYRMAARAGKSLEGWVAETERARAAAKRGAH